MKTSNEKEIIEGVYKQHNSGDFGFIDIEGEQKGYFVHFKNRDKALDGDTVEAEVKIFRGKKEAIIKKIIKRSEALFSGVFLKAKNTNNNKGSSFGFVRLNSESITKDIFIAPKNSNFAKNENIVLIKITSWNGKNPEGKIVKILGKKGESGIEINSFIAESGFREEFFSSTKKEISSLDGKIKKQDYKKRTDLTNLLTYTIDSKDAKDLDDAVSIEYNIESGNYKLYVHIADVTNYVLDKSALDKEAFKRGTSVYLSDRVIPMLPEKLSNNICSLNNGVEKLTLTCEMHINSEGEVYNSKIYESIINSDYRLTYKEIDQIIKEKTNIGDLLFCEKKLDLALIKNVKIAWDLKTIVEKNKILKGVLNFDFPETKVIVENYKTIKIEEYIKYESNKLVEEFMILANETVAQNFSKYPFLYRVHELPTEENITKLQNILNLFNINHVVKENTPKEYQTILSLIRGNKKAKTIEKLVLRTLSKAEYRDENLGHFGLASKNYSHFTSPIRRYPDLQIHRIIKEKLHHKLDKKRINHYKEILSDISKNCSDQERKAEKLEYKVRDYYIIDFYSSKLGEEFEAEITSMIGPGMFVELSDSAEGFIEMIKDDYLYNEELLQFKDKETRKTYNIGDKIRVNLDQVDKQRLRLNFIIVN